MTLLMGMTLPYDEKKFQELLKSKQNVVPGLSIENLYDHINELEIKHNYDHKEIVRDLKYVLMEAIGKIVEPQKEEGQAEEQPKAENKQEA